MNNISREKQTAIERWLIAYDVSHKNKTNKKLHLICVPVIVFSLITLAWIAPFPSALQIALWINWATASITVIACWYFYLSPRLTVASLFITSLFLTTLIILNPFKEYFFTVAITLFIIGWVGQFIGHAIEGKQPAFFNNLLFLLIGPLWIMKFIFDKSNIKWQ